MSVCYFRLPPRSRFELRYSGVLTLRCAVIHYRRFWAAYGFHLLLLDSPYKMDRLPRNVGTQLPVRAA
jgi:hypothetical protein